MQSTQLQNQSFPLPKAQTPPLHSRAWRCGAILSAGLLSAGIASAQNFNGAWLDLGPAPAYNGQVENIINREVVGAINAQALHPTDANIMYAGGTNGGLWKTTNATSVSPNWQRIGDSQRSLSIGALEFDPTDASLQTLVAGYGRSSSLGGISGTLLGVQRTTNGGTSWTALDGAGAIANRDILGIAGRGASLVIATDLGVYRSNDTGATFSQISAGTGTVSGLPAGRTTDLVGDKLDNARLFTALVTAPSGGSVGIYRSNDTGQNWTLISDAAINAAMVGARRVEMARGAANTLFVAVVASTGRLSGVFRSADLGSTWTAMGVPTTVEDGGVLIGAHPGSQGGTHLAIAADPSNANLVYVSGDRQPFFSEGNGGSNFFPNSIGAQDYSGRSFRGDASQPEASRWTPLTHVGTPNNSAPHADSRESGFDALGNLIESNDGGIYKRTLPSSTAGLWLSINGNLQSTEYHSLSYDSVANRVIGGTQDTGTTQQESATLKIFNSVSTGDGGDTAVNDRGAVSVRYSSFQNFQVFARRSYNAANALQSQVFPTLTRTDGSPAPTGQFYTPIAVNEVTGPRLVIGAGNGVYESFDQGDTIARVSTSRVNANSGGDPLVYGVTGNPDFLYFGSAAALFVRTAAPPAAPVQVNTLNASSRDLAVNPANASQLFAITAASVFYSSDAGANFANISGNLAALDCPELRSMAFVPAADPGLVVGCIRGIFVARASSGYTTWAPLGTGFPNAIVFDLDYDVADQVLVAGFLGRGAWKIDLGFDPDVLFRNGFEN